MKFLIFFTVILLAYNAFGQTKTKNQFGISSLVGASYGITGNPNSALFQKIEDYTYRSSGIGLYGFIYLRNDSSNRYIKYIRADITNSSMTGAIEDNGSFARMQSSVIMMSIILPISWKITREIDAYLGVGPVLDYTLSRRLTPVQSSSFNTGDSFRPGIVAEVGFKARSGSAFSMRTTSELQNYRYAQIALVFSFSPPNTRKKRK